MKKAITFLMVVLMLAIDAQAGIRATGGTVNTVGDIRTHTYTQVGTSNLTVTSGGFIDVLVVAGGGGGGSLVHCKT